MCRSGDEKELEKYRDFFFSVSYDRLRIYIHILQSQCNPNLNRNEKYKEKIDHDINTL